MIDYLTINREKKVFVWLYNIYPERFWKLPQESVKEQVHNSDPVMISRMEEMLFLITRPQDYVILHEKPDQEFCHYLKELGFELPNFIIPLNGKTNRPISQLVLEDRITLNKIKSIFDNNKDVVFMPYAITVLEEEIAKQCNIKGIVGKNAIAQKINSKLFVKKINEELKLKSVKSIVCTDELEIEQAVERLLSQEGINKVAIKQPIESSGKGVDELEDKKSLPFLLLVLKKKTKNANCQVYIVEEWCEKQLDINCQLYINEDGTIELVSIKEQIMDGVISIGSNEPCSLVPQKLEEYINCCISVAKHIYRNGYSGFLGIDSLLSDRNEIYPVIEINARFNMSTCISFLKIKTGAKCHRSKYFNIFSKTQMKFSDIAKMLLKENILYTRDNKAGVFIYTAGTIFNPELSGGRYTGRIFTVIIANTWERIEKIELKFIEILKYITAD